MVARIGRMRTFITILLIVAAVLGVIALYLFLTTPDASTPLRIPLSAGQRQLLARVPAQAEAFALIPTAALLHRKLLANPVTRDAVAQWTSEQPVPQPWLIGGADVAVWKIGKTTSYAIRLDAIRAFLVRIWMMASTSVDARWDGSVFVINDAPRPAIDGATLDEILRLANGLPEGDVLIVQRRGARGMFPPIGRPAVTSVRVTPEEILLTARAESDEAAPPNAPVQARYPRGALLAGTFGEPPRLVGDVGRLVGTDIGALIGNGGSLVLYDIDTGTLLPRPKGVIAIPSNPESRAAMADVTRVAQLVGETRDTGRELLVSFDRTSVGQYLNDAAIPATWPANRWSARIDAARMAPILERLGDNRGLRFAAPRLHRAARDLRRWIGALQNAASIEAADSISGGVEELRVRIASK